MHHLSDKLTMRRCPYCHAMHYTGFIQYCPLNPKKESNQVSQDQELEALYGPLAPYSKHKRGETITYEQSGMVCIGRVLWVCGPGEVIEGGQQHPLRYIVENVHTGWSDTVYRSEVKAS